METILEVKNLIKYYKENKAVNGLEFNLFKGEILGFLGPNGAGKSTTINILSTILKHDDGEIKFFGSDIKDNKRWIKAQLGIVPQELAIFEEISAYKNIEFFTSLYGLRGKELKDAVLEALRMVGLEDKKNSKPITFSGGMKRRLNIACAIAHKPKILILDEPTVGIDPQSRNHILESIKKLRDTGTTIIYTTHYMEEVEEIADRVVIMDKGKKIAEGTIPELMESYRNTRVYKISISSMKNDNMKFDFLYEIEGIQKVELTENCFSITTIKEIENLDKIILGLIERNIKISHITSEEGNLEMVFLKLTGRNLRD
ncbi:ABC-2 type transport system ATP-binding protein [Clostridium saccharoperbutylacetonicum]|uniref:ABC-type multidrug transport system, ATPase component n=1 Tax=Clostridium saccharoperbutylacetonicum N1-4(HMT) TaxID=931276 RepID=M1MUX1_9CLOT|nr:MULTISPECIES: ABC transporter ATP-binding protein [Clostridium]AGF58471.1 ABC-type multidrug transport system, ATPase component [Clostridium saccharoperbutylacetonicum N1-4(HMT)]NRT60751.1 ABC-2 type transport system ATP-binding protein [Clostridium saccharoperbutylacetonicum]NSB24065.1 ABC-2 type transport system ATP-binding protein [Clostridium saccharoperbutylacetonicum]NSB43443.1 ABC-2 type transport system ATP-binding protein [Clostridium saccharoperbutylacetonicum]